MTPDKFTLPQAASPDQSAVSMPDHVNGDHDLRDLMVHLAVPGLISTTLYVTSTDLPDMSWLLAQSIILLITACAGKRGHAVLGVLGFLLLQMPLLGDPQIQNLVTTLGFALTGWPLMAALRRTPAWTRETQGHVALRRARLRERVSGRVRPTYVTGVQAPAD